MSDSNTSKLHVHVINVKRLFVYYNQLTIIISKYCAPGGEGTLSRTDGETIATTNELHHIAVLESIL